MAFFLRPRFYSVVKGPHGWRMTWPQGMETGEIPGIGNRIAGIGTNGSLEVIFSLLPLTVPAWWPLEVVTIMLGGLSVVCLIFSYSHGVPIVVPIESHFSYSAASTPSDQIKIITGTWLSYYFYLPTLTSSLKFTESPFVVFMYITIFNNNFLWSFSFWLTKQKRENERNANVHKFCQIHQNSYFKLFDYLEMA